MSAQQKKAPIVKLDPHKRRIVEALYWLIREASGRGVTVTQYMLVKALFLADRRHLNRFGRPITFDNYVAMNHGPVPSFAYNILKGDMSPLGKIGIKSEPWKRIEAPEITDKAYKFEPSKLEINLDELSESDLECLSEALTVVSSLNFKQLRKLTHEDTAYEDAWDDQGGRQSYPMSYGLLFDVPDFERAEDVAFASRHS